MAIGFAILFLLAGCAWRGTKAPGNVLYGLSPSRSVLVDHASRLTDGTVAEEGDPWDTDLTSVFRSPLSVVEWDLGHVVRVRAAYLQGDNNDDFFLSGSEDGKIYRPIWNAHVVRTSGMRARFSTEVDASVRYVRLTMRGGDASVSSSEVELYDAVPDVWPPRLRTAQGSRPVRPGELETVVFAGIAALALLLHRSTFPIWARALFVVIPIGVFAWATKSVLDTWPPGQPIIDTVRAVSAAVAAFAVLRIAWRPSDMMPRFVTGALALMALLAVTTFYNMWQPQFEDAVDGRNTWVHTWDMRVYFPTAKYFDELGFDGLYLASVEAYLEDAPGVREEHIGNVELRDLRNYDMTQVKVVINEIHAVKNRFSPARWLEFKRDMSYFWKTMGAGGYLGSLRDHGGNATPAWLLLAHVLFRHAVANERNLILAGLLDPLLLLLFFVVAWRTFGVRTALVCVVVYGASTFPWFGSNWAGSTLRNDWMVCAGLGACALRAKRPALGGALCGLAAMIRAFPAVSVIFLVVPLVLWLLETIRRERKIPSFARILDESRPVLCALAGAAACVVVLFLSSGLFFGFEHSWGDWSRKIALHSVMPNINHVGLKALFAYDPRTTLRALAVTGGDWSADQVSVFQSRKPLFFLVVAIYTGLTVLASRGRDLRQAALLGMMMIPIYFYPSNYYLHYVFILPLLIDDSDETGSRSLWALVSIIMLLVCVSEYWGFADIGIDERYVEWSVGMLVGYLVILVAFAWDAFRRRTARSTEEPGAKAPAEPPEVPETPEPAPI